VEKYLYLYLAGLVCLATFVIWILRPDLRRTIAYAGLAGGIIEVVSEYWYLQDYWAPPSILGFPAPEDFLYGFGVTALAACAVPFWFRRTYVGSRPRPLRIAGAVLAVATWVMMMATLTQDSTFVSLWVAATGFAYVGLIACIVRPDLLWVGLAAGLMMGLLSLAGFWLGLNHLIDGNAFLNHVLLHPGSSGDIRILGQVPLDEIVWNVARGFCIAVMYPALAGKQLSSIATEYYFSTRHLTRKV